MSAEPGADATDAAIATVGVVGCGLIGGSFALAARTAGVTQVVVADTDSQTRATALERGIADEVVDDPREMDVDLVLIAVPPRAIAEVTLQLLDKAGTPPREPPTILTDTGSAKAKVIGKIETFWEARARQWQEMEGTESHEERRSRGGIPGVPFVGGHPIAGSERGGLKAAEATLFQGAAYLLTPTPMTDSAAFHRLASFLRRLGCRVLAMDPAVHDRLVGVTSHLPQVLASSLVRYAGAVAEADPGLLSAVGGGFRDATRVAASDPSLWTGILAENRTALLDALDGMSGWLAEVRRLVEDEELSGLEAFLREAQELRTSLPGREVEAEVVDLVIPVDDRPGALAEVTTALGSVGINIEDLSMRHAEDGSRGALVVAVAGESSAERARDALEARGYTSHLEPR